jgi:hypothetical protein
MEYGIIPEAMESLRLPAPFDEATLKAALDIHNFLKQDEGPPGTLDAKLAAHREAALSHLLTLRGKRTFGRPTPFAGLAVLALHSPQRKRFRLFSRSRT